MKLKKNNSIKEFEQGENPIAQKYRDELAKFLESLMEYNNLDKETFAKSIGISTTSLYFYRKGERNLTVGMFNNIVEAYHLEDRGYHKLFSILVGME